MNAKDKQASKVKKEYFKIKKQIETGEIDYANNLREINQKLDKLQQEYIMLTGLQIERRDNLVIQKKVSY